MEALADIFTRQIAPASFNKYLFYIIKSHDDSKSILSYDMDTFFNKYNNTLMINSTGIDLDFCGTLFQLIKNYYINDAFFHLDKYIIIADDYITINVLTGITPKFNFGYENPDILLVRNLNGLTHMDSRLRYIVINYLVVAILGISMKEFRELESLVYGNFNITSSD